MGPPEFSLKTVGDDHRRPHAVPSGDPLVGGRLGGLRSRRWKCKLQTVSGAITHGDSRPKISMSDEKGIRYTIYIIYTP